MRRGTLRSTGITSGLFPSRQAIPQDRDRLRDVVRPRELLLAIYIRLGIGQYDPRVRRDEGLSALPEPRLSYFKRVDGTNDHVPQPRSGGD